jgi:hypothetical protein
VKRIDGMYRSIPACLARACALAAACAALWAAPLRAEDAAKASAAPATNPAPAAAPAAGPAAGSGSSLEFNGVGWVQYGQVVHSTDTVPNNYNGNPVQNSGAQIAVNARINERMSGAVGLGVYEGHALAGQIASGGRVTVSASPYIAAASFTYRIGEPESPFFQGTAGLFHYNYDGNVKDLGLYLLRGSVYPGFLMSGFETADVVPLANVLGVWVRNNTGNLRSDVVLNCETQLKPYFDLSLAYIGRVRVSEAFSVGAGVNLYRLIPNDSRISHKPFDPVFEKKDNEVKNDYQREFIYVDTAGGKHDTTFFGFDGTKLMADFEFDPKALLGLGGGLGPEDLKLYGEAALMGLSFDKAHKAVYGGVSQRMPMMAGFNFPAFGYLDHLSLEVEWYGAKFRDDTWRMQPDIDRPESPIPYDLHGPDDTSSAVRTYPRDNLKWALHAAKTIQGHFKVSGQIANDHFRPGGIANTPATYEVATSTLSDWYWMAKIAYFF